MRTPKPTHRERVALFRLGVIGDLLSRELAPGELKRELTLRSQQRYRPPRASRSRTYSYKTLQRWYYAAKADSRDGLLPASREQGFARKLDDEQRRLLLDMRREHPSAAAELVLSEAIRNGIVAESDLSLSTLRRLFRAAGLPRVSKKKAGRRQDIQRRRWRAENPGDLWHGDVCHLVLADEHGQPRRVLIHGLLDDASRYFTALAPRLREQEQDMLEVFCGALLRHPKPSALYLDNGPCYRGDILALVCKRLDIKLVHATSYNPEARGKMERVWRTMRQRCTDHLSPTASLHQVEQALWSWLDVDYHRYPHAGLLGETPRRRYLNGLPSRAPLTPKQLASALEVSLTRQVRRDGTFQLDGNTYEVGGRHLVGKRITVVVDALTDNPINVTWQEQDVRFGPCNPVANSHRKRALDVEISKDNSTTPFDPIAALLTKARRKDDE